MSNDNTHDAAEPSLASAGSRRVAIMSWEQADQIIQDQRAEIERLRVNLRLADAGFTFAPPTLTDEQRAAIEYGALVCDATAGMANDRATIDGASNAADVLRGLLERPG
jgi:hypothetical protein